MDGLTLAHLTRYQAEQWFLDQHRDLMAGPDEKAKRQAFYKLIDDMVTKGSLPPKARRWQYPFLPSQK